MSGLVGYGQPTVAARSGHPDVLSRSPSRRRVMAACCVLFAAPPAWSQSPSCGDSLGDGARRVSAGALILAWVARPQPIPLDRHFQLDLMLCGATAEAVRVDADMPAHRHGMNYRTSLTQTGPGRYRAEGLLFHMPGRWRLIVDVDEGGRRQRLTDEVLVR